MTIREVMDTIIATSMTIRDYYIEAMDMNIATGTNAGDTTIATGIMGSHEHDHNYNWEP